MTLSLKPEHLKRYRQIVWLFARYARPGLVAESGLDVSEAAPTASEPKAEQLADELEAMGPTFIKLGQLLSTRADFLPLPYMEALTRLQDNVEPFSYDQVEAIVQVEIGARVSKAFASFDPEPLAAASLGQVHRAQLRDGRPVAVKVQRPHIREQMMEDLGALAEIAEFLDQRTETGRRYEFARIIEELRKTLMRELDYRQEAANLRTLRTNLREFEHIIVPAPIEDYTSSRVLTMEYVGGRKVTALTPLMRLDFNGVELAEELFRAYLQQILVDGFFHADPHPGNVFLTEDHRVALIDLGMVARVPPRLQERLLELLLAISEGRSEDAAELAIRIGSPRDEFDDAMFRRRITELVGRQQNQTVAKMQVGRVVLEVTQAAAISGVRVPDELTMLGKTLLNLDLVGRALDPAFDPNAAIRRNAAEMLRGRVWKALSAGNLFTGLLEFKDLLQRLPDRMNRILDALASNKLRIEVDAIDERELITGIQKVANRITVGLIIAALIVGAALLMRVETDFRLFGYPGIAMIFFFIAAIAGIVLVADTLLHDVRSRKGRKPRT